MGYVSGLARTLRLDGWIARQMRRSHNRCLNTDRASRWFGDFRIRILTNWSRGLVGAVSKADVLAGAGAVIHRYAALSRQRGNAALVTRNLKCSGFFARFVRAIAGCPGSPAGYLPA